MKRFLLIFFLFILAAGIGYGLLRVKQYADARAFDNVVSEPPPPQEKIPEPPAPLDPRLALLKERGDGARLAWAPGPGESAVRAAWNGNGGLVISATSADPERPFRIVSVPFGGAASDLLVSKTPAIASDHAPSQGGFLCWSAPNAKGPHDIWCADAAGAAPRQVTRHDGKEDLVEPALSPDGKWLVFEVSTDRVPPRRGEPTVGNTIWKVRADGSGIEQLTRGSDDRFPSWSPDGRRIYFQRRGASWELFMMDADGKNPAPLLRTHDENERWPARRPGSDELVMIQSPKGQDGRVRALHLATKALRDIASGAYGPETHASVSPDGRLASFLAPADPSDPMRLGVWLAPL